MKQWVPIACFLSVVILPFTLQAGAHSGGIGWGGVVGFWCIVSEAIVTACLEPKNE
jgi:hypothetical protein